VVEAKFRWSAEPDKPASDYDSACDIEELVGMISVAGHPALVLGDEVPMSTWLPHEQFSGGILVVPMTWPSDQTDDESLVRAVHAVSVKDFSRTGVSLPLSSGSCRLIAAVDNGPCWAYPTLRISVDTASYSIFSAETRIAGYWPRLHALHESSKPLD